MRTKSLSEDLEAGRCQRITDIRRQKVIKRENKVWGGEMYSSQAPEEGCCKQGNEQS